MPGGTTQPEALAQLAVLEQQYPEFRRLLEYRNPFQLLVAAILSAQTTDASVNAATPALFARYPDAAALANANTAELEGLIRTIGLYRSKTRNLLACARALLERHGGEVPLTMEELTALAGVGRKVAGVILATVAGKPAVIVDTHFGRVARRLGWTEAQAPRAVEADVSALIAAEHWTSASMRLNYLGRDYCHARKKPDCEHCPLSDLCPSSLVGADPGVSVPGTAG